MINNYGKIIRQVEDGLFSYIDEFEDEDFVFGGDSKRFRFRFCVISLSSVIKKESIHCPVFKFQKCLYERFS